MKTNKTIVMRESDLRKLKKDITKDVTKIAIYMLLAWLKDTEQIDNDPDVLVEEYERFESWCSAMDEHLISLNDVKRIIEEAIDRKIRTV